jgi:hypothetical protein
VWSAILVHLLLLFGFRGLAIHALEVSAPLLVLRVPRVKQWFVSGRKTGDRQAIRLALVVVAVGVFVMGLAPFVHNLASSGSQAFIQQPAD